MSIYEHQQSLSMALRSIRCSLSSLNQYMALYNTKNKQRKEKRVISTSRHGYVTPSLSKEDVKYLRLFEEEIEERLKHHDQMRRSRRIEESLRMQESDKRKRHQCFWSLGGGARGDARGDDRSEVRGQGEEVGILRWGVGVGDGRGCLRGSVNADSTTWECG
ncbi:hypothetical protein Tco_0892220 [Tanacetum coccineum]|uniref:Uncharacterized protein n=1 Tax=Tanacetum coccineum TaxID=301880 RepID=A0ABQ5C6N8_9ASTR